MCSPQRIAQGAILLSILTALTEASSSSPDSPWQSNNETGNSSRRLRRRFSRTDVAHVNTHQGRDLINGGKDASHNEYPSFSMMAWKGSSHGCGGSLIASKFVLTAAHCIETNFRNALPPEEKSRYPEWHIGQYCKQEDNCGAHPYHVLASRRAIIHPSYNDINMWDFALLELEGETDAQVMPIDDGSYSSQFQEGDLVRGIGIGQTTDSWSSQSMILKEVDNLYFPTDRCRLYYETGPRFDESVLCSNGLNRGQCSGDSGSPVLVPSRKENRGNNPFVQVGVVSMGAPFCEYHDYPDISARVSSAFSWIVDNVCPSYPAGSRNRPSYCSQFSSASFPPPPPQDNDPPPPPDHGGNTETSEVDCNSRNVESTFRDRKKGKNRFCRSIKDAKKRKKYCNNDKTNALTKCPYRCNVC